MTTAETQTKTRTIERPACIRPVHYHYCPGCCHGIIHNLVGQVIDELGIADKTVGVSPVGCAVLAYDYFNLDFIHIE